MLTEQRYEIILELLETRKSVTVTELKEILDTSESTVRRDITALDKMGRLTKVLAEQFLWKMQYLPMSLLLLRNQILISKKKENCQIRRRPDRTHGFCISGCGNHHRLYAGLSGEYPGCLCDKWCITCKNAGSERHSCYAYRR